MSRTLFKSGIRLTSVCLFAGLSLIAQVGCSRSTTGTRLPAPGFQVIASPDGASAKVTITSNVEPASDYPIRYTLDGSIPGKDSPLYSDTIILRRSANITARAFPDAVNSDERLPSLPATRPVVVGKSKLGRS